MLRLLLTCLVVAIPFTNVVFAQHSRAGDVQPAADYEKALTRILQQVVTDDGRVRYDLLRGPLNTDFRRVLKAVEEFEARRLKSHEQKMAFWLNAYNVQMLQNVIETPAVNNIVEDGYADAFFNALLRTARTVATLNEIENVILRRQQVPSTLQAFQVARLDPRLHVALNCAAVSCPRLRREAFTAATLDATLDMAMRDFVASPAHFRVENNRVILSSLLDWYGADFDRPDQPAGDYLLSYMPDARPDYAQLKQFLSGKTSQALKTAPGVQFEYQWMVNRARH